LISERPAVINQIRSFLLERGIPVRQGLRFLRRQLPEILAKRVDVLSPRTGYVTFWLGSVLIESSHVTKNQCDPARCSVFTRAIVEPGAARNISLPQNGVFLSRNLGGHK
jgi:hypothetical protein